MPIVLAFAFVALGVLIGRHAGELGERLWRIVRPERANAAAPAGNPTARHAIAPAVERSNGASPRTERPRVAIVIDDLGRSIEDADRLLALGRPLTYAVLPFETKSREVIERLAAAGAETLCHLPMEGREGANPGPNAIVETLSAARIAELTAKALDALPEVVGVNNHMGSRITADPEAMAAVLGVIAPRRLFFLDSRTTAETVAYDLAQERSIPALRRDVFLDESRDPAAIEAAFERTLEIAREQGHAIAIGHPHEETLALLERRLREPGSDGVEWVTLSQLLEGGK